MGDRASSQILFQELLKFASVIGPLVHRVRHLQTSRPESTAGLENLISIGMRVREKRHSVRTSQLSCLSAKAFSNKKRHSRLGLPANILIFCGSGVGGSWCKRLHFSSPGAPRCINASFFVNGHAAWRRPSLSTYLSTVRPTPGLKNKELELCPPMSISLLFQICF